MKILLKPDYTESEVFGINVLDREKHLNLFSRVHFLADHKKQNLILIKLKKYKFWISYIGIILASFHTPRLLNYQYIYKFGKVTSIKK